MCAIPPPSVLFNPMKVPPRLLLGPGPSNPSKRVLQAMKRPVLGPLHKETLKVMDDIKEGLKYLFQTCSTNVFCVSGTGHAGMESLFQNLLERNESVLIARNGIWGDRAANMARRLECNVKIIDKIPGEAFALEEIEDALEKHRPLVFFIVHVESSTGVFQPLEGIGDLCRRYGTVFVVDCVASLGGTPFWMDRWGVDAAYTGTQKVLGAPPSLAPVALGNGALNKIKKRKSLVGSFYFDFIELMNYWNCSDGPRRYHHTIPVSSIYALREALSELAAEGLESSWRRHRECSRRLQEGILDLGLELFVANSRWMSATITTVKVPKGISCSQVTDTLMERFGIEIGGGLGPTAKQVWRIGLLGQNCTTDNVDLLLQSLASVLRSSEINWTSKL